MQWTPQKEFAFELQEVQQVRMSHALSSCRQHHANAVQLLPSMVSLEVPGRASLGPLHGEILDQIFFSLCDQNYRLDWKAVAVKILVLRFWHLQVSFLFQVMPYQWRCPSPRCSPERRHSLWQGKACACALSTLPRRRARHFERATGIEKWSETALKNVKTSTDSKSKRQLYDVRKRLLSKRTPRNNRWHPFCALNYTKASSHPVFKPKEIMHMCRCVARPILLNLNMTQSSRRVCRYFFLVSDVFTDLFSAHPWEIRVLFLGLWYLLLVGVAHKCLQEAKKEIQGTNRTFSHSNLRTKVPVVSALPCTKLMGDVRLAKMACQTFWWKSVN